MISKKEYSTIVKNNSPKSKCFVNGTKAFFIGGFICLIGQVLTDCYSMLDLSKDDAKTLTSVTLIFIGILLTAIGVYDKIAKHGGAGTLVPITGFANAVSSPAIEFKPEGYVAGLGAKLFRTCHSLRCYRICCFWCCFMDTAYVRDYLILTFQ